MVLREQVLKLWKAGKTYRQIMNATGLKSSNGVAYYLNKAGFRIVRLTEKQIILLESILIQIKPTSEFTAEALYEIGEALKTARIKS